MGGGTRVQNPWTLRYREHRLTCSNACLTILRTSITTSQVCATVLRSIILRFLFQVSFSSSFPILFLLAFTLKMPLLTAMETDNIFGHSVRIRFGPVFVSFATTALLSFAFAFARLPTCKVGVSSCLCVYCFSPGLCCNRANWLYASRGL